MLNRKIGVITTSRADYGLLYPILKKIEADADLYLSLIVSGSHLSPAHGMTLKHVEEDGFSIAAKVEMLLSSDTPNAIASSIGLGVIKFTDVLQALAPDVLVVLGDRFEILAAVVAALPLKIPIAHIHGGEVTVGAMDDAVRHAVTKMSHLHFVATDLYAKRVMQMGEEPWRVYVVGSPAIDNLILQPQLSKEELQDDFNVSLNDSLLITYHPVTLEHERTYEQIAGLLSVLGEFENELIFTAPNADISNKVILREIQRFVTNTPRAHLFTSLGRQYYPGLLRYVQAMVGNSSSGLIEASTFELPVVNIGSRQEGRLRSENVIDTDYRPEDIRRGITEALDPKFRRRLVGMVNPYGNGTASRRIVDTLKDVQTDPSLLKKGFCDLASVEEFI